MQNDGLIWLENNRTHTPHFDEEYIRDIFRHNADSTDPDLLVMCSNFKNQDQRLIGEMESVKPVRYLAHLSNEALAYNTDFYSRFDFVFRNYFDPWISSKNCATIPVGYQSGFGSHEPVNAGQSDRRYNWCFIGALKNDRAEALVEFRKVEGGFEHLIQGWMPDDALTPSECAAIYRSSVFVPCPMGNIHPDCYRVMEALEHGAIPVVRTFYGMDYFRLIYGDHPFILCTSWRQGAAQVAELLGDQAKLTDKQREVRDWYWAYKSGLREDIKALLSQRPDRVTGRQFLYQRKASCSLRIRALFHWHFVLRRRLKKSKVTTAFVRLLQKTPKPITFETGLSH